MSITPGYKEKRKLLVVALKRPIDTAGTDYIANGAPSTAMLTKGLTVTPWQTEQVQRDLDTGQSGGEPVIHTSEMITISGAVEMAGSGTPDLPVAYSPLLQMSALTEEPAVGVNVSHNRILLASEELDGTCYFHWEGDYHILLSGKATLTVTGKIGEIGYINYEIKGIYGGTVSGDIPAATFPAFQRPKQWSKANTHFEMDSTAYNLIEYELSNNLAIEHDQGTEVNQIFIDDWSEEVKFTIEAPALTTYDPFAVARTNTKFSFLLQQGTAAGEIFRQSSPGVQILTIEIGEYKGKKTYILTCRVIQGNDSVIETA